MSAELHCVEGKHFRLLNFLFHPKYLIRLLWFEVRLAGRVEFHRAETVSTSYSRSLDHVVLKRSVLTVPALLRWIL
jgi:hypothetical protein